MKKYTIDLSEITCGMVDDGDGACPFISEGLIIPIDQMVIDTIEESLKNNDMRDIIITIRRKGRKKISGKSGKQYRVKP